MLRLYRHEGAVLICHRIRISLRGRAFRGPQYPYFLLLYINLSDRLLPHRIVKIDRF